MIKKLLKITGSILTLLPLILIIGIIIAYIGIVIANNYIADQAEKELKAYPLPAQTALVESISVAGKLTGNGNGMQYMGAILVTSDLSKQEILAHYRKEFNYIEVQKQTTPVINSLNSNNYRFDRFDDDSDQAYYAVIYWGSHNAYVNDYFSTFLDFDIRGH